MQQKLKGQGEKAALNNLSVKTPPLKQRDSEPQALPILMEKLYLDIRASISFRVIISVYNAFPLYLLFTAVVKQIVYY